MIRLYCQQIDQDRSKIALADLDSILGESELRDVEMIFWQRYKLRIPTEIRLNDTTISQESRELAKRMLYIFNIWKVKNLEFQLTTIQKKRKLGENLHTDEVETEEVVSKISDS